jgi:hypothetical protein
MAKVKIQGNASGTGVLTLTAPNTSTDRTITLPDEDVTLGAATPSIDDNGNATAITIDSSENVLVGKTTSDTGNSLGFEARQNGLVNIGRDGGEPLLLNRNTSDGDIVAFRKDGTTKGSIGVTSSGAYITLGGTGAANTLDDYEEGTWTASLQGANQSGMNTTGYYTKIGRQVFFQWYSGGMTISSASGPAKVTGLPFTSSNASSAYGLFIYLHGNGVDGGSTGGYVQDVDTTFRFVDTNNITDASYVNGTKYIMVSGSYFVS